MALIALTVPAAPAAAAERLRDTDAPVKVRVGAPYMEIPITAIVNGSGDWMAVSLVDPRHGPLASDFADAEPDRPWVFKLRPEFYSWSLPSWGQKEWRFEGYRTDASGNYYEVAGLGDNRSPCTLDAGDRRRALRLADSSARCPAGLPQR